MKKVFNSSKPGNHENDFTNAYAGYAHMYNSKSPNDQFILYD